jgi:peptidylprolyl isomerase
VQAFPAMNRKILIPLLTALVGALVIAGCGDDDSDSTSTGAAAETTATEDSGSGTDVDTSTKPEVEVPDGPPPEELEVDDIVEGDGPVAEDGSLVTVQYVGVDYETGEQFDASWDNGQPFSFQLGSGSVIEGWDEGVQGMKVGGRRELVIPPDLAYGKQGSPPDIGPNATLVFVVDLLEVG